MKRILFCCMAIFCLCTTYAQQSSNSEINSNSYWIKTEIYSKENQPLSGFILYLIKNDNPQQITQSEIISDNGDSQFFEVPQGHYFLQIVDQYNQIIYTSNTFTLSSNIELPRIVVDYSIQAIDEIIIEKKQKLIDVKEGKLIYNVENSIASSGSSAWQILEQIPGITIDGNDQLKSKGKSGVLVQIDGKTQQLSNNELADFLKGISSDIIEKIEVNNNPNAATDAAGNAILNIKLKKGKKQGTNGVFTNSISQGRYPKTNHSLSLNHRTERYNIFGSYNFNYREIINDLTLTRRFFKEEQLAERYTQKNFMKVNSRNHSARTGIDYNWDEKHLTAASINFNFQNSDPKGNNHTDVFNNDDQLDHYFKTNSNMNQERKNIALNINHRFVLDSLQSNWTTDLDWARFNLANTQRFTTRYLDLDFNELQPTYILRGIMNGDLSIASVKTDYIRNFINQIRLQFGVKSSLVTNENKLEFYTLSTGSPVFDPSKSNHFLYKENINAGYFQFNKEWKKSKLQAGIRVENTNIKTDQKVNNQTSTSNYTQLFPSIQYSYEFSEQHSADVGYNKTITRPNYEDLNPFKYYMDQKMYREGNPFLNPAINHEFKLNYAFLEKYNLNITYSIVIDDINQMVIPLENDQSMVKQTFLNMEKTNVFSTQIILPIAVTKWWNTVLTHEMGWLNFYGNIANTTIDYSNKFLYNTTLNNNYNFGNRWLAELSIQYKSKENFGYFTMEERSAVNLGLQKNFDKFNLKFAANDIFNKSYSRMNLFFTNYHESFDVQRDNRVFTASIVYPFGESKKTNIRKTGGAEDLKNRAVQGS